MAKDLTLINPSGTVVTLTKDTTKLDHEHHVFPFAVEDDFRAAGYREVEDGDVLAPQHWEAATAPSVTDDFSARAIPASATAADE